MKTKRTFRKPAWAALGLVLAFSACENPAAGPGNNDDPVGIVTPATNEEHLAMLKNLGVNINPDLPVAPNGQPYNPQVSSGGGRNARAGTTAPEMSLGPLGKIFSQPKREIFVAGYPEMENGKNHVLYEDFEKSTLTVLDQDGKDDSGWAGPRVPRKSVAADLNGDGIDEVVIVTAVLAPKKILINKGEYKNGTFTVTQVREFNMPDNLLISEETDVDVRQSGWKLIAADLNGDGKQECVFTLPAANTGYVYILDNNLAVTQLNIQSYVPAASHDYTGELIHLPNI